MDRFISFLKLHKQHIQNLFVYWFTACTGTIFARIFIQNTREVPYIDSIYLLNGLIDTKWSDLFFFQLGSHFQGIGFYLMHAVLTLFSWRLSSITYLDIAIQIGTTILILALSRKLHGRLTFADAVIPLILFTLRAPEVYVEIPNVSYVILPLLLLFSICYISITSQSKHKYLEIYILGILLITCGWGIFALPIFGILLLLTVARSAKKFIPMIGFVSFVGIVAYMITQYQVSYTVICPYLQFNGKSYLTFINAMISYFFLHGIVNHPFFLVALGIISACMYHLYRAMRAKELRAYNYHRMNFILYGFTCVFMLSIGTQRACLGPIAATAGRYSMFFIPALIATYFDLRKMVNSRMKTIALTLFILLLLITEVTAIQKNIEPIRTMAHKDRLWQECYRNGNSIVECSKSLHFWPGGVDTYGELDHILKYAKKMNRLFFTKDIDPL